MTEKKQTSNSDFLSTMGAPARRALENSDITTLQELSRHSEKEILQLHGMGKTSIPKLKLALRKAGLSFRKEK